MEEQRQRQEEEVRKVTQGSTDQSISADTAPTGTYATQLLVISSSNT